MNQLEAYNQTQVCLDYIKNKIKEERIHAYCENASTIERSNALWNKYINKFKQEAFKLIGDSLSKPYVIYRINRYYQI